MERPACLRPAAALLVLHLPSLSAAASRPAPPTGEELASLLPASATVSETLYTQLQAGAPALAVFFHVEQQESADTVRSRGRVLFALRTRGKPGWRALWQGPPVESAAGTVVLGGARAQKYAGLKGEAALVAWRLPHGAGHRLVIAGYGIRRGEKGLSELFRVKEPAGRSGACVSGQTLTLWHPDDPPPVSSESFGPLLGRPVPGGPFTRKRYWIQTYRWKSAARGTAMEANSPRRTRKWFLPEELTRADPFEERSGDWLRSEPVAPPVAADLARARKFVEKSRYAAAVPVLRRCTAREPLWDEPWVELGRTYLAMGESAAAASALAEAVALDDRNPASARMLGQALVATGDLYAAESALRAACMLDPASPGAWQSLGQLHESLGEGYWASQYYQRAVELSSVPADGGRPARAGGRHAAAAAYAGLQRLEDRVRQQRRARGAPEEPGVYVQEMPVVTFAAQAPTSAPARPDSSAPPTAPAAPTDPQVPQAAAFEPTPLPTLSVSVRLPSAWDTPGATAGGSVGPWPSVSAEPVFAVPPLSASPAAEPTPR